MYEHDYVVIDDEDEALDIDALRGKNWLAGVRRMVDQIMAQEDAEIFKTLEAIAASDFEIEHSNKDS